MNAVHNNQKHFTQKLVTIAGIAGASVLFSLPAFAQEAKPVDGQYSFYGSVIQNRQLNNRDYYNRSQQYNNRDFSNRSRNNRNSAYSNEERNYNNLNDDTYRSQENDYIRNSRDNIQYNNVDDTTGTQQ